MSRPDRANHLRPTFIHFGITLLCSGALFACDPTLAQTPDQRTLSQEVEGLKQAIEKTQWQLKESQRQLDELRHQLGTLEQQVQNTSASASPAVTSAISDIQERQALEETQIATHEQTKVESESKYPVKVTGLVLFTGFVNTGAVDAPSTPTIAVAGSGSAGASVRQTVLGVDATGPRLFGAHSGADVRIDFEGAPQSYAIAGYSGPYAATGLLRLRTAHAALTWDSTHSNLTKAYFSLDRPIISPDAPTSLTAVAEPALAWSGDLWTWNPQLGITEDIRAGQQSKLRIQAALIDAGDAPQSPVVRAVNAGTVAATASEQSRWPGVEARLALYGYGDDDEASHVGIGGYFSKHNTNAFDFDAWAATVDARFQLGKGLQISGNAYRGAALGGLGGGGYKDYIAWQHDNTGAYYYDAVDDIGGWAQMKKLFNPRWEANIAYGSDNAFSREVRRYLPDGGGLYQDLVRNTTYTGNVIFRPSAYLLFSVEYRHIDSAPIVGSAAVSNIIGVAAGYKF